MASSGVEFEEDTIGHSYTRPASLGGPAAQSAAGQPAIDQNSPKMVQWLMKHGIVRTPKLGQVILVVVVVINLIITFLFLRPSL